MVKSAVSTKGARKTFCRIVSTRLFGQVLREGEGTASTNDPPFGDAVAVLAFVRTFGGS